MKKKYMSKRPVFIDYPNIRPIDRRRLKKYKDRVYTSKGLLYNPFDLQISSFLIKVVCLDVVYVDRRLFKRKRWVNKSPFGKNHNTISMTRRIEFHRLFDTPNKMLTYKLKEQ